MQCRLWEPFRIGQMELRNRIVMPPMGTNYANEEGYVTERLKNYYEARARGGVGLIIIENTNMHPAGRTVSNHLEISDDRFIAGLSELVNSLHKHGAKAAIQIGHGGRRANSRLTGKQPVAPSALTGMHPMALLPSRRTTEIPRALTIEEIAAIVIAFRKAAERAQKAGFDGVEIHGAHGYLLSSFLSRSSNKRDDIYGGSQKNRARFLCEVITSVREALGKDYPVWCRINGKEFGVEEGTTLEEAQETARLAQDAGVNAIHLTAFGPLRPEFLTTPTFVPAVLADLAEGIKKAVTVPVIAVGRITPEAGEKMLAEGNADLVSIGKGLIADPDLPNKIAAGNLDDIRPCIICINCLDDTYSLDVKGIRCSVNASMGREDELKLVPAEKIKKVLIVGGGPAGMEAARVAAQRGHQVTLWEEHSQLGGQLNKASVPPHKDRIGALVKYFKIQLTKLNVQVELGKKATAAGIEEFGPEALVLAAGAEPVVPRIPGLDNIHTVQALDVLEGKVQVGDRVVVIGGGMVGCETAEFLVEKDRSVTVVEILPEMAVTVGPSLRTFLLDRLDEKGVTLLTQVKCEEVIPGGVVIATAGGEQKTIGVDTIILAVGASPNTKLGEEIKGKVAEVYQVGDCIEPRKIRDAIGEGYRAGLHI